MSIELAKAFCARLMSDDEFREAIGAADNLEEIKKLVDAEYQFSKDDLLKVVSEFSGQKVEMSGLKKLVLEAYEEEIKTEGKGSTEAVAAWLDTLQ